MNQPIVYKFGGASVKNADAVKNLAKIIINSKIQNHLIIVISAMGKMTNAFEKLVDLAHSGLNYDEELASIKSFHIDIIEGLFENKTSVLADFNEQYDVLKAVLIHADRMNYDFAYDQIVCFGELFSTKIISNYLNDLNIKNEWIDARRCILTDSTHRSAIVNYEYSSIFILKNIKPHLESTIVVTQGFIASNSDGNTTTLGREGSDFTAAILASCVDAQSVTIWKDVDGILNADPKKITAPIKYDRLTYEEVIEMSYYGATVIHPKTLKPLANKNIPLFVRSFIHPEKSGTEIGVSDHRSIEPAIILKENQALITFRNKDLSFMEEENITHLMSVISELKLKINLIQKSALNFSVITDFNLEKVTELLTKVKDEYLMHYNSELRLITIKNYKDLEIPEEIECKEILLEQKTRKNIQYLVK